MTVLNKVDLLDSRGPSRRWRRPPRLGVDGRDLPDQRPHRRRRRAAVGELIGLLPEGPFLYPPEDHSDQPEQLRIAELVREQVLLRTREELPHAVEVEIDEIEEREDGLLVVRALVWAETESQKGILVGAGGRMVKAVGSAARPEIEALLGRRVHLDLHVRVRKGWRRDEALLGPARDRMSLERIV